MLRCEASRLAATPAPGKLIDFLRSERIVQFFHEGTDLWRRTRLRSRVHRGILYYRHGQYRTKGNIVTDLEVENLEIGRAILEADVWRVARVVADRYQKAGTVLTWRMMREIEEETLCDISLLGRWPLESLLQFVSRAHIPPYEDVVSGESSNYLIGLPAFIHGLFSKQGAQAIS